MMVSLYHIQQHSTISSLPFCQLFPLAKKEKTLNIIKSKITKYHLQGNSKLEIHLPNGKNSILYL